MRKIATTALIVLASFTLGFAVRSWIAEAPAPERKVTGIGGIFFKCKSPKATRAWYHQHLGLNTNPYGAVFQWYQGADSTQKGYTQWSPFKDSTDYFLPSKKDFMINYRVVNMDALLKEFKRDSVVVIDTIETYSYGKFLHIMDPDGNKIELWEPYDKEYGKMGSGVTR